MPSLRILSFVATVAISAFTSVSALPVALSNVDVMGVPAAQVVGRQYPPSPSSPVTPPTSVPSAPAPPTPNQPESLLNIIDELTVAITPSIENLGNLSKDTATSQVVAPLVQTINGALSVAITKVNALLAQPVEVVLATADGVVDIQGLAKVLQPLVSLIFTALSSVLKIVGGVEGDVFGLIKSVASLTAQLLNLILKVVGGLAGGLLATLLGIVGSLIIGTVIPVLNQLGLAGLVASILSIL